MRENLDRQNYDNNTNAIITTAVYKYLVIQLDY